MPEPVDRAWTCLLLGTLVASAAGAASPLGTAAHEKARPQRLLRETGADDWIQSRLQEGGDLGEDVAWEAMILRHQEARKETERRKRREVRAGGHPELPQESREATLDRVFQRLPLPSRIRPEVPWTTGGFRPSRAYHKEYPVPDNKLAEKLGERIPSHMDPVDLKAREHFGRGVIEIGEALKRAIAEDGAGLREAFSGGPYEVRELVVKNRSPVFRDHRYGIVFRFTLMLRGIYQSQAGWNQPCNFKIDCDALVGGDGLVRADIRPNWDPSVFAAGGAPPEMDHHLLEASNRISTYYGPLELQGVEARLRDVMRGVLLLPRKPAERKIPNPYQVEVYIPIALRTARLPLDLDGNGRADPEVLTFENKVRRVNRGPRKRGEPLTFDFQQYAGWEVRLGQRRVLAGAEGRIKLAVYGDTDGDGLPDLVLVEDRGEKRISHQPYEPAHQYFLRPAIYFLDGQDLARDLFDLGPVRFDFPPGADGSEVRQLRLEPRLAGGEQQDWDVAVEIFDPLGRVLRKDLVFDRYPSNRKLPEDIGYQRAEFAKGQNQPLTQGIRLRVHFDTNREGLTAAAVKELERVMGRIGIDEVISVRLTGHADERNTYEHNLDLGRRRARSVARWLSRKGIRPNKMKIDSRGEYDPIDTNVTDAGMARNRRVDGWVVTRPAPPDRPPWYGRIGTPRPYPGSSG